MKNIKKISKKKFTLIELIIVIVVIGILAGMALPKFVGVKRDAAAAGVKNDADVLQTVAALIESDREQTDANFGNNGSKVTITGSSDLETALVAAGFDKSSDEIYELDEDAYKSQLSKTVKTGDLSDFGVVTSGDLAGTVVFLGYEGDQNKGVTDGKGAKWFGVDIVKN